MSSIETFEKFETETDEFNDKQTSYNSRGYKLFEQYLNEIFAENSKLNVVFIYNYTRSFEDGDPTFARHRIALNHEEAEDNGFKYPYEELDNFNADVAPGVLSVISTQLADFKGILENKYGTNWLLIAEKEYADVIKITKEEYYCE